MSAATTLDEMKVRIPEDLQTDPLAANAPHLGPALARRLRDDEDQLIVTVLEYAKAHDYTPSTSTIVESWRMSIRGLTAALCAPLEAGTVPPPIDASAPVPAALTHFARFEAAKHRERGVDMRLFLGLLKYYRTAYIDVAESTSLAASTAWETKAILRFFDLLEVEFVAEWVRLSEPEKIDELQRKNRELTNAKNKFLTIFESLADPSFMVGKQGDLQHVNEVAAQTFEGLAALDRYYGEALPAIGLPALEALIEEADTEGAPARLHRELRLPTLRGPRLFSTSVRRMLDISGKFEGLVVTLKDITERELAEQERQHLEIQLRHAQQLQAIDQLAAGLAHDINTPLQYLSSNLEFLQSSLQSIMAVLVASSPTAKDRPEDGDGSFDLEFLAEEMPDAIRQSWEGLQKVRQTIITLRSFGDAGATSRRSYSVNQSARAVTDLLRSTFAPAVDIELSLDPEVPELEGDGSSMRQILYDLLLNSGQAIVETRGTHPDEAGHVLVSTAFEGHEILLQVRDDGPGIPEEARPHIYEPFVGTHGAGSGLAYVHRTVTKALGGRIDFECPSGGGCVFSIHLPRIIPK